MRIRIGSIPIKFGSIRSTIGAGMVLRIDYGNGANKLLHTLFVVDNHLAFKWWSKTARRWIYEIMPAEFFHANRNDLERIR